MKDEKQISLLHNAGTDSLSEWKKEQNHVSVISNDDEISLKTKESLYTLKNTFQEKIIHTHLFESCGYGDIDVPLSIEDIQVIKTINAPAIKQHFSILPGNLAFLKYLRGIVSLVESSDDYEFLKKLLISFCSKWVVSWAQQSMNFSDCITSQLKLFSDFIKTLPIHHISESILFTSSISDPKNILELGNRKIIKARSCLDFAYIDPATQTLLSFVVDPGSKVFLTWQIESDMINDPILYEEIKSSIKDKTLSLSFDALKKILNIQYGDRSSKSVAIPLKDAIARKIAKIGILSSTGDPIIIKDNCLFKDNVLNAYAQKEIDSVISVLSHNTNIGEYVSGKVTLLGTCSPGGTYSDLCEGKQLPGTDYTFG